MTMKMTVRSATAAAVVEGVHREGALVDGRLDGYVAIRFRSMRREPARHQFSAEPVGGA